MHIFAQSPQATPFDILLGYRVNLGGWFVLEPFISPALFQKYPGTVDEWTLSTQMTADTSPGGGLSQIETHYQTFIVSQDLPLLRQLLIADFCLQTEEDFAQIAGAGLNWVRIPIPFWAIDTWGDEPFLAKTSWKLVIYWRATLLRSAYLQIYCTGLSMGQKVRFTR